MTPHDADPGWLSPVERPSTPSFRPPPGSVDAHCHVFGPASRFPYAPQRRYTPADAPKERLFALRDHLGIDRQVVVQATCHGTDNSALIDALRASAGRARGVAVVDETIGGRELRSLHDAGVRAVRFNLISRLADPQPDIVYRRIVDRVAPFGWHVVIYLQPADLATRSPLITTLGVPVVVDHMARLDVTDGLTGPGFLRLVELLDSGLVWVKVSCPERLSRSGPPDYADVVPYARALVDRFPDRVLWGSDWPHPNMSDHMPDDGRLLDLIPVIAVSGEARRALLVDNPTRLYWET